MIKSVFGVKWAQARSRCRWLLSSSFLSRAQPGGRNMSCRWREPPDHIRSHPSPTRGCLRRSRFASAAREPSAKGTPEGNATATHDRETGAVHFCKRISFESMSGRHMAGAARSLDGFSIGIATITFTCSHGVDHVSASGLDGGEVDTGGSRHRQRVCRAPPCQRSKSMHYFRWEQAQGCAIYEN